MSIYSIEKIESEAVDAAKRFSTVNEACPYPFGSTAGFIFTNKFKAERQRQEDAIQNAAAADIRANLDDIQNIIDTDFQAAVEAGNNRWLAKNAITGTGSQK